MCDSKLLFSNIKANTACCNITQTTAISALQVSLTGVTVGACGFLLYLSMKTYSKLSKELKELKALESQESQTTQKTGETTK